MTFWDLLITNQKSAPPEFGLWYFILPASLLVVGYFSIKYAQSKSYQRFWYWAQLIQVLTINAWYILAHMPLTDNLPFIIVAWLCLRSSLLLEGPISSNILPCWVF